MKYKLYPPQPIYELGQRGNQEDTIYPAMGKATEADRLFIVCDGMGGHEHGEVASNAVATTMAEYINSLNLDGKPFADQMLADALERAYAQLDALDTGEARKMGTTLTLLYMHRGGITVAHIGDSRIYHLRPATGELLYVSRDHSLVMDLYQAGEITKDEMRTSPQKNIITRAMSPGEDNRCRADVVHITDVKPGDYFYLCSDGMLEQMTDEELLQLLSEKTSDEEKRQALIEATKLNKDNHSAYLLRVASVEAEEGDEMLPNDEATSRYNAINVYRRREAEDAQDVAVISPPPHNKSDVSVVGTPQNVEQNSAAATKKTRRFPFLLVSLLAICLLAAGYFFLKDSGSKVQPPKNPTKPVKVEGSRKNQNPPSTVNVQQSVRDTEKKTNQIAPEQAQGRSVNPTPVSPEDKTNSVRKSRVPDNFQKRIKEKKSGVEPSKINNPDLDNTETTSQPTEGA